MIFFLAKGEKIVLSKDRVCEKYGLVYRTSSFQTTWQNGDAPEGNHKYRKLMPKQISTCQEIGGILADKTLQLEVGLHISAAGYRSTVKMVRITGDVDLGRINVIAEKEGLIIEAAVIIRNFGLIWGNDVISYWIEEACTNNIRISEVNKETTSGIEWHEMMISNYGGFDYWNTSGPFEGFLDVIFTFTSTECSCASSLEKQELIQPYRTILNTADGADLSIISSAGSIINCHQALLKAYSDKFECEIKGTLSDPGPNFFKMSSLTEEGVQALLEYMYLKDISKADANCAVALELYAISEKYGMTALRDKMRCILITKPDAWYKAEMIMKFYSVTLDGEDEEIKKLVVKLIKTHKNSINRIIASASQK